MDRRNPVRIAVLVAFVVVAAAAAFLLSSARNPSGTHASPTTASAQASATAEATASTEATATAEATGTAEVPATAEATGVVVEVDTGGGLGDVSGFTLRVPGGELLTFSLRELENGVEFPPGHLVQHQADAFPVRVLYRMEGSERLAIRLEDAPP